MNDLQGYIPRAVEAEVLESLSFSPVTVLLGPRQCGKSTLARRLIGDLADAVVLDLQSPADLRRLEDAEYFFRTNQNKLICLDEVQRGGPELFSIIRVCVDAKRTPGRFLLLGSASPDLIAHSSESLTGRVHFIELTPLLYDEFSAARTDPIAVDVDVDSLHWVRGGFAPSLLADSGRISAIWREDYVRTYLERDLPQLGEFIPAPQLRQFFTMLAHYHGQLLNKSKLAQSLDVSKHLVRKWLALLEVTYMIRVLPPFFRNSKKRLVKSAKVYLRDSGILHALLDLPDHNAIMGHPVSGPSFEGWCIEQIITALPGYSASFYRTASGEEIDLIMERGECKLLFEIKSSSAPRLSRGFAKTIDELSPTKVWVVARVKESWRLKNGAEIIALGELLENLKSIVGTNQDKS